MVIFLFALWGYRYAVYQTSKRGGGMRRYWNYLKYVLRHKWFVFLACWELGIPWQGIIHDWHKFMPREFIPYARFFNNPDGSKRIVRDKVGYYKPDFTGDPDFDMAWFWHQKLGKHHWQYWTHPASETKENIIVHEIPEKYLKEMFADWIGAGKAQGTPDTAAWYLAHKNEMQIHEDSRRILEFWIGVC